MTIAELLVQTTATLSASGGIDDPFGAAWRIVAAIYGPPCEIPRYPTLFESGLCAPNGGDACKECGWPRSQHGAKP